MLVVLTLIGLISAVAWPRLEGLYHAAERATERDRVVAELDQLAVRVARRSQGLVFHGEGEDLPIDLPSGWSVRAPEPIEYLPSGACEEGGRVLLLHAGSEYPVRLDPPTCRVVEARKEIEEADYGSG